MEYIHDNLTVMSSPATLAFENDQLNNKLAKQEKIKKAGSKETNDKPDLVWLNIVGIPLTHIGAVYGAYLIFTSAKIATTIFAFILVELTQISVTAGPHRLWSHRSYKAKWPLRLILMILHTMSFEVSILKWARDHRVHHKYSDTDADPYNSKRGFFYSHMGWIFRRKTALVLEKGKQIDVSDLLSDPIVRFQHKYFPFLGPFATFLLPPMIAVYYWNETWNSAIFVTSALRWVITIHSTFLINSFAHMYGNKPYDKNICPTQNKFVAVMAMGEGWHNYHHAFPWDYRSAELGHYFFNHTAAFIDFFAWLGWAYDLKTVAPGMIKARVQRTGDGSHEVWGWGDKDITNNDKQATVITHKKI